MDEQIPQILREKLISYGATEEEIPQAMQEIQEIVAAKIVKEALATFPEERYKKIAEETLVDYFQSMEQ